MKIQNSPAAYGWLAGLLVLLLAAFANASCAHYPLSGPTRTMEQRSAAAVGIYTECGSGSGVLIDGTHVLTAFHVINCAEYPEIRPADIVVVHTLSSTAHVVLGVHAQPHLDLARLDLDTQAPGVVPVRVRRATIGETTCAFSVEPKRSVLCGPAWKFSDTRLYGDVRVSQADYWFGNSGSGVYGADGSLVGILTRLNWCSPGDAFLWAVGAVRPEKTCGGYISSLTDSTVWP